MARISLRALLCAVVLFASTGVVGGEHSEQHQKTLLAVQVALEQGQQHLQRGDYAAAVAVLEKQVPYIDGNKRYLEVLRDAYRGLVGQLEGTGQSEEAKKYRGFLEILDPVTRPTASATNIRPAVHRGKIQDDDPFSSANGAHQRGQMYLVKAERAYEERNYEAAARLYQHAERVEPGCVALSQERWAYCRLYVVAQELNRPSGVRTPSELEQEIRQALRMAPRLERFGQGLLARLKEASAATVEVEIKHTPRRGNSWALAETANFCVFHLLDEEQADKIVRVVESVRVSMARKWFGEEPSTWNPRCEIYIHPNGQAYARATGASPAAPGHSSISLEAGRVLARRVDIRGDDPNYLVGVLPHETTHVVLAGRFGSHHVPRWADEGIAVLTEPRERIDLHLRNLSSFKQDGLLFGVAELMALADYPEPRRVGAFYAQSISVVEFLMKKKDPVTLTRFIREGLDGRYEAALEKYYGYRSFADLEQDWHRYAFGQESIATISERRSTTSPR